MSSTSKERGLMLGDFCLGSMWHRLGVLLIAAGLGFALGYVVSPELLTIFSEEIFGDVRTVVGAAPFTLPTFLALWWFRTYDSRQQSLRANFETGVQHVASDTPAHIEIGVEILKNVSAVTSSYDREIRTAFIWRLKQFPAVTEANRKLLHANYRFAYAQHILRWIAAHGGKWDLTRIDLRYQEFTFADVTLASILNLQDASQFGDSNEFEPAMMKIKAGGCRFTGNMTKQNFFGKWHVQGEGRTG